jgi:flagellar protein FlaG
MGFSLTGTHIVFFIASVIIASAVSGVFIAVIDGVMTSFSERGKIIEENLESNFIIINDPDNIPLTGSFYNFYVKNIGSRKLATTNETFNLFIDGEIVIAANYNFSDNSIQPDEVGTMNIDNAEISSGDHTLRLVGPQDIVDEFIFTI